MNRMLLLFASLAALMPLSSPGVASEPRKSEQVWAAVTKLPQARSETQRYHVRITSGVRFDLLSTIVEAFPAGKANIIVSSSAKEFELVFSSSPILVLSIDEDVPTIAPDDQFPYSATSRLAKDLKSYGISNIQISALGKLLEPLPQLKRENEIFGNPFQRRFAFRHAEPVESWQH